MPKKSPSRKARSIEDRIAALDIAKQKLTLKKQLADTRAQIAALGKKK